MGKALETLRRIEKGKLDHASVHLAALRENLQNLVTRREQLQGQLQSEGNNAIEDDPSLSLWLYQDFLKSARAGLDNLDQQISEMRKRISEQEKLVAQLYRDMRRFEIVIEQKEEERRQSQMKQENAEIEDIVQSGHARSRIEAHRAAS